MRALVVTALPVLALAACTDSKPTELIYRETVTEVLACTDPTGGFGGKPGRCRVSLKCGGRETAYAPVAVGDQLCNRVWGARIVCKDLIETICTDEDPQP